MFGKKASPKPPKGIPVGTHVLVHSGYDGGQYIGKAIKVEESDSSILPVLFLSGAMRYQPRGSTAGDDTKCYWRSPPTFVYMEPGAPLDLQIKERDCVYVIGDTANTAQFVTEQRPINPRDKKDGRLLTGKHGKLKPVYKGSRLVMVR